MYCIVMVIVIGIVIVVVSVVVFIEKLDVMIVIMFGVLFINVVVLEKGDIMFGMDKMEYVMGEM